MRLSILIMVFLIASYTVSAQNDSAFDHAYDRIWKEMAHGDLDGSLAASDTLYAAAQHPAQKVRSLILKARLFQQKEDLSQSIVYIQKAETIAAQSGDLAWQTRANVYLSGIYRMMELYDLADEYARKGVKLLPRIRDYDQQNTTRALLFQERGFSAMDQERYRDAISHFTKAGSGIDKFKESRAFNLMNNERLLADNYRLLKSYDTAISHYKKALEWSKGLPVHYVLGFVFKGLSETALETGDLETAKAYLAKAENVANVSEYLQLKESVYALAKDYHTRLQHKEALAIARERKDSVTETLLEKKAAFLNTTFQTLEQRGTAAAAESARKTVAIIIACVIILLGISAFLYYRKKKRAEMARVKAILEALTHTVPNTPLVVPDEISTEVHTTMPVTAHGEADKERKPIMSPEKESELLHYFYEFEQSAQFLEKGFTLSALASLMRTNTKYVSHVIKQHKKSDFNGYINALRIEYIIKKLNEDPEWRKYKVSFLADKAGFSSHSQFSEVFKTIAGLSPSVFISHLKKSKVA